MIIHSQNLLMANVPVEVRPRMLGEIFDDAWRLYLNHLPLFLLATGLPIISCAVLLVLLLTQSWPTNSWVSWLLTAGLATLLPCTGLGAALCQEVFHCWGEKQPVTTGRAWRVVRRRWLNHLTCQSLLLLLPLAMLLSFSSGTYWLGCVLLLLLLPLWPLGLAWHAVITGGQKNVWRAFRYSRRCVIRHTGKAAAIVGCRFLVFVVAVLNLHLFVLAGVWISDQFGGFNVGVLYLVLTMENPVYFLVLLALAWWVLAPYHEAVNYLFYMDARTRYEGVDLWYCIEQNFPVQSISQAGAIFLALGGLFLFTVSAQGQTSTKLETVHKAHQQMAALQEKAETAKPYPGGQAWANQMRRIGNQLDPESNSQAGRYKWFFQSADKLGTGEREDDLQILGEVKAKLAVIEKSWTKPAKSLPEEKGFSAQEVKQLVPPWYKQQKLEKKPEVEPPENEQKPPDKDNDPNQIGKIPNRPKVGIAPPLAVGAGAGQAVLYFLIAVMGMVLLAGVVLALVSYLRNRKPKLRVQSGQLAAVPAEEYLDNPDQQDVPSLWRKADDLARAGQFLEALRTLYLGVLALLHQAHFIRYERTRTNGEYADQLRKQPQLHPLFLPLTSIFELKWYGERACAGEDYSTCREMAVQMELQARNKL